MFGEEDGPETATDDAIPPEEQEMIFLDNEPEPELVIAEYTHTEENTQEQEQSEEPNSEPIAPPAESVTVTEQEKQEAIKQQQEEEEHDESDFRLPSPTDDFLQPDVAPDIPSQVSQLTVITEYGGPEPEPRRKSRFEPRAKSKAAAVAAADHDSGRRTTLSRDTDSRKISGDFTIGTLVKVPSKVSEDTYSTQSGEDNESERSHTEKTKVEVFDRAVYYQMYNTLTSEMSEIKIRNNFLQIKMVEYFRRRKMEHVFKETDQQIDTQQKYWKRLDTFHDLLELDRRRRLVINAEVNELRKERNDNLQFLRKGMKELLEREKDVSVGLINTKTGKEIPEKVLERLLRRQYFGVEQVARYRLKYIKIRNRVAEKQEALQAADKLGENLRLIDYEQLKMENRGFADKVEDRDEELTKLRNKCDSIFQVLAHLREKSASATLDIIQEQQVLQAVGIEFMEARERTNYFKIERDRYRSMVNKIRDHSGILLYPTLLTDMENTIEEANTTKKFLADIKENQKTQLSQLRAIRKNIEIAQTFRLLEKGKAQSPSRLTILSKRRSRFKSKGPSSTQKLL